MHSLGPQDSYIVIDGVEPWSKFWSPLASIVCTLTLIQASDIISTDARLDLEFHFPQSLFVVFNNQIQGTNVIAKDMYTYSSLFGKTNLAVDK